MTRSTVLLNPGPVMLTERVRSALLCEDQCHREPEFAALMLDIRSRLARVYPAADGAFAAILLTGSGTCAVETMLASLAPTHSKTLVVANGVYGERMAQMLQAACRPYECIRGDWLAPVDLKETRRRLAADPSFTHVASVHHETTTGRLNDIDALGEICRQFKRPLLLDVVSSFGGERIDFTGWNLAAVAGTANKCLHGVPGASFVLVSKAILETSRSYAQSMYLDLFRYYIEQQNGYSPFTSAIQVYCALREALAELEDMGGWESRHAKYRELSDAIGRTLNAKGVPYLLPAEAQSSILRSFRLPSGLRYADVHDRMRDAGIVIYAGQAQLCGAIFRIAVMGDIRQEDVERFASAADQIF